jgi:hypothetical protein
MTFHISWWVALWRSFLGSLLLFHGLEQFEQFRQVHWLDIVVVEPCFLLTLAVCFTWLG